MLVTGQQHVAATSFLCLARRAFRHAVSALIVLGSLLAGSTSNAAADTSGFPVSAANSYDARYKAIENTWRYAPMEPKQFIIGEAEKAGLKLSYDPNAPGVKQSLFQVMQNRPLLQNFGFNPFSAIQGYMVGKAAFTSMDDQSRWLNYFKAADYTTGFIGSNAGMLMHWTATYLICQEWPSFVDGANHNAVYLKQLAHDNLETLLYNTFHQGDHDRGDVTYSDIALVATKVLATYTSDPVLKQKAVSAYYAMLVTVAEGWNQGYFTFPALREKHFNVTGPQDPIGIHQVAWILFGDTNAKNLLQPSQQSWMFTFPSDLNQNIPQALIDLGQSRTAPVTFWGYLNDISRKYIYHSPSYTLASLWVGGGGPTNVSTDYSTTNQTLKWQSEKPKSVFRIGNENYAYIYPKTDPRNKYGLGHNPYSRVFQHQSTQMGVLNLEDREWAYKAQYAMFPTSGALVSKEFAQNGWIFCNAGKMFFAVRFAKQHTSTIDNDSGFNLIVSDYFRNGWVLETAEESRYASIAPGGRFAAFVDDVSNNTKVSFMNMNDTIDAKSTSELPRIIYTSIHGYTMEMEYDAHPFNNNAETLPIVRKINKHNVRQYSDYPTEGSSNKSVRQKRLGDNITIVGNNQEKKLSITWGQDSFLH